MTIKLFVKEDCPRCPAAKHACAGIAGIEVYDVGEIDGLAEASFYGILATPSVLVLDGTGHEVVSWRGAVPDRALLTRYATAH
jgi:hypothetical protein